MHPVVLRLVSPLYSKPFSDLGWEFMQHRNRPPIRSQGQRFALAPKPVWAWLLLACALPLVSCQSTKATASQTASQAEAQSLFDSILPTLEKQTQVPLVLPTDIPYQRQLSDPPLSATVRSVTPDAYEIVLGTRPDCDNLNCRFGSIMGQKLQESEFRQPGQPVTLAGGLKGYFVEATCTVSCTDSTVSWLRNGYLYSLSIKAAPQSMVVDFANSAL